MRFLSFLAASLLVCAALLIVDAVSVERKSESLAPSLWGAIRSRAWLDAEPAPDPLQTAVPGAEPSPADPHARFTALLGEILGSRQPRVVGDWLAGEDPIELADAVIEEMSEQELIEAVAGLSSYPDEELRRYRDLRGFVRRLSRIALEPEDPDPEDEKSKWYEPFVYPYEIEFSTLVNLNEDNTTRIAQSSFATSVAKIYAVFPTQAYAGDHVLVRWRRTDQPSLLLLDRYPILVEDHTSYVWLRFPEGWPEGEYHVSVFTDGERPRPLAGGEFGVQAGAPTPIAPQAPEA